MLLPSYRSFLHFNEIGAFLLGLVLLVEAKAKSDEKASYVSGQAIPVSCLNRTMYDTSLWNLFHGRTLLVLRKQWLT